MHTESNAVAGTDDRPADPWALLSGSSVTIVAALCADLLRLGVHEARRVIGARTRRRHAGTGDWHRPCTGNRPS